MRSRILALVLTVVVLAAVAVILLLPRPQPRVTTTTVVSSPTTAATVSGVIDFYTSIPKNIASELVRMFMEKYPNIKVNLVRSGTSKLMAKLLAEAKSGKIIADVVWLADPASINVLKSKGLLLRWTPPEARYVPEEFRDPDGYWVAGRIILQVIAYNTKLVSEPPKTWKELADGSYASKLPEEWRGKAWLAMPNPLYSGAATATVYALTGKYGWEFFKKLKSEGWLVVEKSNGVVLQGILAGKYPVGITLDYMVRARKAAGDPVDYVLPADGVVAIPSPIAIMKDTPYPEAAKLFVRFMLSKEVQEFLASKGVIPARTDVSPPPGAPNIAKLNTIPIDWNKLSEELEKVKKTFEELVLGG